jgi:short-subunit dehydrogenase
MFTKFIITGTSSGVGKGTALELLGKDREVVGVSSSNAIDLKLKAHNNYKHLALDLDKVDAVLDIDIDDLVSTEDSICLILNAAQFSFDNSLGINIYDARKMFNINFFSSVALVNLFRDNLKRVIFINSISGLNSQANQSMYSSSKHALQAYSEILSKESVDFDFDVMSFNPGGINTPLWDEFQSDVNRSEFLSIKTVVSTIVFLSNLPSNTYVKNFTLLPQSDVIAN